MTTPPCCPQDASSPHQGHHGRGRWRGSPNSRNGSTPKTLAAEVGAIGLDTPRDRAGSFEPRLVPKGARRAGGLDEMIVSLYAGGMTVRDIQHHLARTLGTELSHETISNITDAVLEEVKAWQGRPLEEIYPILYLDVLVIKVRDGHQVRNRAAHIAVGVDLDGVKHVLGIWVAKPVPNARRSRSRSPIRRLPLRRVATHAPVGLACLRARTSGRATRRASSRDTGVRAASVDASSSVGVGAAATVGAGVRSVGVYGGGHTSMTMDPGRSPTRCIRWPEGEGGAPCRFW